MSKIAELEVNNLSNENSSRSYKWRRYGTFVIALSCLASLIMTLGDNWVLSAVLGLGVLTCGTIGVFN